VSNEFVYENQFVIEIDTHIKFIEQNKSKKKYYVRLHILKILYKIFNLYKIYKPNYRWIILISEKIKHTQYN